MYLKSLEVHGFKSFANKIDFQFHNGITGIVGPNGSGKSNVADAVRWVLGEQSAKQLRGGSMQDVIFAGTENRKPMSYAYVAITLDNTDKQLPVDYTEVTIARRVYRSGESEYLLNGSVCRLKDVSELFYDTGIGKEGYSIIGQGQIDRILSGKPEERRELFDEAAGIVKYKKRKAATQKKLDAERENLLRVSDILTELERQVEPLQKQAEKARIYLRKREEQKEYDVNFFLIEAERIEKERKEVEGKIRLAGAELTNAKEAYGTTKQEYERLDQEISTLDQRITELRDRINHSKVTKERLEGQIRLLAEQIRTAETTDEHLQGRLDAIDADQRAHQQSKDEYATKLAELQEQAEDIDERREKIEKELQEARNKIEDCNERIEQGQKEIISLLNRKVEIEGNQQRFETTLEQLNIRRSGLNKRLLERKTRDGDLEDEVLEYKKAYESVTDRIAKEKAKVDELIHKSQEWKIKNHDNNRQLEEARGRQIKLSSMLESRKNIAERYDGYGNSIRRVMQEKENHPGLIGVVSDLIQVDKRYEIAIETALGGSIQNIVTEDEETAKQMIAFLKKNRYGRATFLPLTSVRGRYNPRNEALLGEKGIVGIASKLVSNDSKYDEIVSYLLGRVIVADTIDHALAVARKNHFSLHIVTLEGESLSPGGSMTGGAFKNTSNLLARNREIEELEKKLSSITGEMEKYEKRRQDIQKARSLADVETEQRRTKLQQLYIEQNTAKLNYDRSRQQKSESDTIYARLRNERGEIDKQIQEIEEGRKKTAGEITYAADREKIIREEGTRLAKILEEESLRESELSKMSSEIQLEAAGYDQNRGFLKENLARVCAEMAKLEEERGTLIEGAKQAKEDVGKKHQEIEEIRLQIGRAEDGFGEMNSELESGIEKKNAMSAEHKGFFKKTEELSERMNALDKELFRLSSQKDKLKETDEAQTNYMWEEYELTPHAAEELRREEYQDAQELKEKITKLRDEIRQLGSVNVNAIEEYREQSKRYEEMKGQHDDIVEAEQMLLGIIEDLDVGMRTQFTEKFAEIQKEFDKSFKLLFGGGKGTLELVEEEDILECGIRIIAQPPGKKLQNMMQLSGGEKALSAIALLFAIQALKPSPFCLLDEIEAALDDSNVSRYANYLNKLTKDTQFIVITHRRGTMTAADRLYGITMQEKGVSTLVSVNLIEEGLTD